MVSRRFWLLFLQRYSLIADYDWTELCHIRSVNRQFEIVNRSIELINFLVSGSIPMVIGRCIHNGFVSETSDQLISNGSCLPIHLKRGNLWVANTVLFDCSASNSHQIHPVDLFMHYIFKIILNGFQNKIAFLLLTDKNELCPKKVALEPIHSNRTEQIFNISFTKTNKQTGTQRISR